MTNNNSALSDRSLKLLEKWAGASERYWRLAHDDSSMGCYGPGYLTWGVQSNWNYIGAMATLSAQAEVEEREKRRERAVSALRFALATHVTGHRLGNDGKRWGNSWISMLGIERCMHGLALIEDTLAESDADALRRVLVSEADWLLLNPSRGRIKGIAACLWNSDGCNNPESNIWSGALLWRVALKYPDEPHAADWREQACRFLVNGVSVEADASDATIVDGRPIRDRHVGANFFPHYALDHHGYLNVGYMAVCVSNAAMLHFDLKRAGQTPPESLYHHQHDLWRVLRRFIFGDGRLARIGGDSRVRYAYCQEYLLPSLLFAADCFNDAHALELAEHQLGLMETEAAEDGTFYGRRLNHIYADNPHYYTRMESDRACVLAMLVNYLPMLEALPRPPVSFEESVGGIWLENAHGAAMHRSEKRIASFAWRAHGLSQGLCLPPDDGSFAEWALNLCPALKFLGDDGQTTHRQLLDYHIEAFDEGFVTCGSVMEGVNIKIDEGASCTDQAVTHIAFAALPDGQTCLCLQYAAAAPDRMGYLAELKVLHLVIPNDVLNNRWRELWTRAGRTDLTSPPEHDETLEIDGEWLNIDDRLGVMLLYGGDRLLVDRSVTPRAGKYKSLFTEEICSHLSREMKQCVPGEVLADIGFAVLAGASAEATERVKGGALRFEEEGIRGAWAEGGDGKRYTLVANFSARQQSITISGERIELPGGRAVLQSSG